REVYDHARDRIVRRIAIDVTHEAAVDLDQVGGNLLQVIEGGVASAEVVQRELRAATAQALDEVAGRTDVVQGDAFGDLEAQLADRQGMIRDHRERIFHEAGVVQR